MRIRNMRKGARVEIFKHGGRKDRPAQMGTITGARAIKAGTKPNCRNFKVEVTLDSGEVLERWIHRVKFVSEPVFKDPYRLYVCSKAYSSRMEDVTNKLPPVILQPRKGYEPALFEKKEVQDIVDIIKSTPDMVWNRSNFFKIIMKIKKIYIGFNVKK
jgi:hypothetical protein